MSKTGFIYSIENDINSEIYIGATTKSLEQRFKQHVYDSKNPTCLFHKFINEQGKEHFTIKLLKTVTFDDIFELLAEEKDCIKNFGTLNVRDNYEYHKKPQASKIQSSHSSSLVIDPILYEEEIKLKSQQIKGFLSCEEFVNLFLDETTLNIFEYLNIHDKIHITNKLLEWLGYEGEEKKQSFIKILARHGIPFEYIDRDFSEKGKCVENSKERKSLILNCEDFKKVAMLKKRNENIKTYYLTLEKLVKHYTGYLNWKLENFYNNKMQISMKGEYIPKREYFDDAGVDLKSMETFKLEPFDRKLVSSGIKASIPYSFAGFVMSRSGLANKHGICVLNSPGIVDSGYTGEIFINLINLGKETVTINKEQKIAQLIIQKIELPSFVVNQTDSEKLRGEKGHGSTG